MEFVDFDGKICTGKYVPYTYRHPMGLLLGRDFIQLIQIHVMCLMVFQNMMSVLIICFCCVVNG